MTTLEKTLLIAGLAGFAFLIWYRAQQAQAAFTTDFQYVFNAPSVAVTGAMGA